VITLRLNKAAIEMARAKTCMRYDALEATSGVSRSTVFKGYRTDIDPVCVGKIAKALGVPVEEIVMTDAKYSNEQKPGEHEEVQK